MDIELTEEQELLRSSLQRLLRDAYAFDARRKILASEEGFSRDIWRSFAELGLLAAPFPEEVGGLGGGTLATMNICRSRLFANYQTCRSNEAPIIRPIE